MFDYSLYTDIGDRSINEDSIGFSIKNERACFVLCDGLGGHGMGDVASGMVKNSILNDFEKTDDNIGFLENAFINAQKLLIEEQKRRNVTKQMKSTANVILFDKEYAYIGHIGDSRTYIFKRNKIFKRTLDHSVPQKLVLAGEIGDKEIRNHPDRNKVLRAMGEEWNKPKFELMEKIKTSKCNVFLICSDGFWENIEDSDMCRSLKGKDSADAWMQEMVSIVKNNSRRQVGERDNNSAIAIWVK